MSCYERLVCVSHDPPIHADGSHNRGRQMLLDLIADRGAFAPGYEYADVRHPASYTNVAVDVGFLLQHPDCEVWVCSEYGDWTTPTGFTHSEVTRREGNIGHRTGACTCGAKWPHRRPWHAEADR